MTGILLVHGAWHGPWCWDGVAEPPVLVGHSLGGLVVQRYLERGPARAGVLLAPVPPGGTVAAFGRIAVRHPLILAKTTLFLSLRPFIGSSTAGSGRPSTVPSPDGPHLENGPRQ